MTLYFNPCNKYCWTILSFMDKPEDFSCIFSIFILKMKSPDKTTNFNPVPEFRLIFSISILTAPFSTVRNLTSLARNLFTCLINLSPVTHLSSPQPSPPLCRRPHHHSLALTPHARPLLCGDACLIPRRFWCSQWIFFTFIQSVLISFFMTFYSHSLYVFFCLANLN